MVKAHEAHMVILDGAAVVNMIKPRTPVSPRTKIGKGIRRHVEGNKQVPSNWQEFLRVDENKSELFHLISDRMKNFQDS